MKHIPLSLGSSFGRWSLPLLCVLTLFVAVAAQAAPVNNAFAYATATSGTAFTVTGSNVGATKEAGEPSIAGNAGGASVWWYWTAPSSGTVTLSTAGSSFDTMLGVCTGSSVSALTVLTSNDDSNGTRQSQVTFTAVSGTRYSIVVDGYNGMTGNISLSLAFTGVTAVGGPANNNFANAFALSGTSATATGSNAGATKESGEPTIAGNAGGASVWWYWTAPASGTVTLSTAGSSFDTMLGVCTGSSVSSLAVVVSNDDANGTRQSQVTFSAVSGTRYAIVVDGFNAVTGSINLSLTFTGTACTYSISSTSASFPATGGSGSVGVTAGSGCSWTASSSVSWITITAGASGAGSSTVSYSVAGNTATSSRSGTMSIAGSTFTVSQAGATSSGPINNNFASATLVSGTSATVTGSNAGANKEAGEPNIISGNSGGASVWWYWTAPSSGTVTMSTAGSSFDTMLGVYTGGSVSALTPIASNDDANGTRQSLVTFSAVSGVRYALVVDGYNGVTGNITLSVSLAASACTYAISSTSASFPATGGSSTVGVTAGSGCTWTASSGASWITITAGASGAGSGTVGYSVAGNTASSSRSGTLSIAGSTFTVSQAGATSSGPINNNFASATLVSGTSATVTGSNAGANKEAGEPNIISGNAGGASVWWYWTAPSSGTVTMSTAGSSFDTMLGVYTGGSVSALTAVASNDDSNGTQQSLVTFSAVSGTRYAIVVDGYSGGTGNIALSVSLSGGTACAYSISPTSASYTAAAGSATVAVTATAGCVWSASSSATWISITAGSSGTGNGTVYYSVQANTATSSRSGTLTVAGRSFTVSQAAASTADTSAPTVSITAPSSGSTVSATIAVSANASDNLGVSRVELYRDGTLLASDTASPYSVSDDTTRLSNGSHSYMAKAYDAAGNTSSSTSTVTVSNGTTGTAGQLLWLKTNLPTNSAQIRGVAVDHGGNVIAVGDFYSQVNFGGGLVTAIGYYDAFVVKYTPQGALSWVKRLAGAGYDSIYGVAVDAQDNIVVAGTFQGSGDFGGGAIAAIGGSSDQDSFVAKYSSSGSYVWARTFGSIANDMAMGVAVDGAGNVLVASQSGGVVNFGNGITLTGHGGSDVALVKFLGASANGVPAGTPLWAKLYGGSSSDIPRGLAVDRNGDAMVTGTFGGVGNLGGAPLSGGQLAGFFVAKYSGSDGSYKWSRIPGGNDGYGVTTDPGTGNVYVTGGFTGSVDFGGGAITTPWGGSGGLFVAAYNGLGAYQWAKAYGGNGDKGFAVAVDGNGNLALTGQAGGTIDFAGTGVPMSGTGYFLANFTTSGAFRWAKRSNQSQSWGSGLAFDGLGRVMAGGSFYYTIDFGGLSASASGGNYNTFVGQYTK